MDRSCRGMGCRPCVVHVQGVGVQMHCVRKQISRKKKTAKKKTDLGVDDGRVRALRCVACRRRLVQTKNKIKNKPTDGVVDTACGRGWGMRTCWYGRVACACGWDRHKEKQREKKLMGADE